MFLVFFLLQLPVHRIMFSLSLCADPVTGIWCHLGTLLLLRLECVWSVLASREMGCREKPYLCQRHAKG